MMDFHCSEQGENELTACVDKNLMDPRVYDNLKINEEHCTSSYSQISSVQQQEVTHQMRSIVSEWMMEVCEEQNCQVEVFLLSMNYVNRFLLKLSIKKNQLQLLGAACMLLASKLREPRPLTIDMLVYYTDHSITRNMLSQWELLVLSTLQWNINAIVPVDFLPHLLQRLPIERYGIDATMAKNHAKILITLCAREVDFSKYHPSIVACASVASALCGLGWTSKAHEDLDQLLVGLQIDSSIDKEYVRMCYFDIDNMVQKSAAGTTTTTAETKNADTCGRRDQCTPPPEKVYAHETLNTPTDVCDVCF